MLPYGCKISTIKQLLPKHHISNSLEGGYLFIEGIGQITKIVGDCTACVVSMESMTLENLSQKFKIYQDVMSVSGRINAFFSKTVYRKPDVQVWLDKLEKFNVVGLNVQKSNRDPHKDWWQISGILKCPNPYVNSYEQLDALPDKWKEHNSQDVTKYNKLATLYKHPKLKETNYATV